MVKVLILVSLTPYFIPVCQRTCKAKWEAETMVTMVTKWSRQWSKKTDLGFGYQSVANSYLLYNPITGRWVTFLCFEVQHHNSVGRVYFQLGMELKAFTLSKLCTSCSRCRTFWVKMGWRSVTSMWGRGWGVYLTLRGTFLLLRSLTLQPCMGIIIIIIIKENHSRKIIITFSSGILRTTSALITSPSSVCTERQKPSLKVCRDKKGIMQHRHRQRSVRE